MMVAMPKIIQTDAGLPRIFDFNCMSNLPGAIDQFLDCLILNWLKINHMGPPWQGQNCAARFVFLSYYLLNQYFEKNIQRLARRLPYGEYQHEKKPYRRFYHEEVCYGTRSCFGRRSGFRQRYGLGHARLAGQRLRPGLQRHPG
jgi:hypothetical protein